MKYRVVDLLRCPDDGGSLVLDEAVTRTVSFSEQLTEVRCAEVCALKGKSPGAADGPTPADCTGCYSHEIASGSLTCSVCHRAWPVVRGIPRLTPGDLATDVQKAKDTFSYEWKMFRFGERNWGQDIEHRRELFLDALGASPADLEGKLILDAGCGSGLLSMEMANTYAMEVLALDLASGIEQAYQHNDNPYVYFVQGSVLNPPIREKSFDYLYCAGVWCTFPTRIVVLRSSSTR